MNLRVLGILLLVPCLFPRVGMSQMGMSQIGDQAVEACIRAIPRSDFKRVGAALEATIYDAESAPVLPAADLLTQAVALRVRSLLGGGDATLPAADSLVDWRDLSGSLIVTASRDGSFKWRTANASLGADTMPRSALRIVKRAMKEVSDEGERMMWPDNLKGDSIVFEMMLKHPLVGRGGVESPLRARQPIPVFTVEVPWSKPVELIKEPRISYPEQSRAGRATGGIRLSYTVDKDGSVVPGSIAEAWPETRPPPPANLMNYYRAFVRAVGRALPGAKFSPALIGGCAVRQRVVQAFEFKLD